MREKSPPPLWTREDIDAVRRREPAAWRRFLKDFGARLRWEVRRYCPWQVHARGAEAARTWVEERLNDFIRHLLEKDPLRDFDESRSQLGSYLCLLAGRVVISHLRKERDQLRLTDLYAAPPESGFAQPFDDLAEAELVIKLLERYRERVGEASYATFVMLFLGAACPISELADAQGRSTMSLHKARQRIREQLRGILDEMEAEGEVPPRRGR